MHAAQKVLAENRSPPVEVEILRRQEQNGQIARDERSKDAQISPPVAKCESERLEELVADFVRAVPAYVGRVVEDVARRAAAEEIRHVVAAVLARGGAELLVFAGRAFDFAAVHFGHDHAANQACEGVELVEPDAPEFGDQGLGDGDTAEEGEDDDDLFELACGRGCEGSGVGLRRD